MPADNVLKSNLRNFPHLIKSLLCRISCGEFPTSHHQPWVIRKINKQNVEWRKGDGIPSELAKSAFCNEDFEKVSVFQVHSDLEEAIVLGAIALETESSKDPAYGLRLSIKELKESGVLFEKTDGETGIPDVDDKHWDISCRKSVFDAITEKFLKRQRSGRDHVRAIYDKQLHDQWRNFELIKEKLGPRTKKALEKKIAKLNQAATQ